MTRKEDVERESREHLWKRGKQKGARMVQEEKEGAREGEEDEGRLSRRRDCVLMYGWHSDDNRDKLLY